MLLKQLKHRYIYTYLIIRYDIYSKIFQYEWSTFRWALLLENWYTKLHKVAYTGLTLLLYSMEKPYKGASPGPIALSRCRCAIYLNCFSLILSQHLVTFIYFASEQHQVFHNVTWGLNMVVTRSITTKEYHIRGTNWKGTS